MHPAQILDAQADLRARLTRPRLRQLWRFHLGLDYPDTAKRGAAGDAAFDQVLTDLDHHVAFADVYHVTPNMTELVRAAAAGLDETDQADRTLAPTATGLARFDDGLPMTDVRGNTLRVNWIAWGPIRTADPDTGAVRAATAFWMWNDHHTQPDDIAQGAATTTGRERKAWELGQQLSGRWGLIGMETFTDGQRLGPPVQAPGEDKEAELAAQGLTAVPITSVIRYLHAFWLLLGQTVSRQVLAPIDKNAAGRAKQAGLPGRVTVIELRRAVSASEPSGEPGTVAWRHRWLVKGHWRWNVCGPKHPLAQEITPGVWRARIWVAPFEKGPESMPLVQSRKVYALRR